MERFFSAFICAVGALISDRTILCREGSPNLKIRAEGRRFSVWDILAMLATLHDPVRPDKQHAIKHTKDPIANDKEI